MIRPALPGDAKAVAAIWNAMIRDTANTFTTQEKDPGDLRPKMADFIVWDAGTVLGFATYGPFRNGPGYRYVREHSICLAPSAQGHGIGRMLLSAIEDKARKDGIRTLVAAISGENTGGIAFHTRMGFQQTGHMPQIARKFDRWMDLILMQKSL